MNDQGAALEGIWRLVEARAWDADGRAIDAPPYGRFPIGQITFGKGRMLAALCNGDADAGPKRAYSSYGGAYRFDGKTLVCTVDIASDPSRIGGEQVRDITLEGERMRMRPPLRSYGGAMERRELVWERVWRAFEPGSPGM